MPDQAVLTSGGSSKGDKLNLAARSATGKWIVAHVADEPTITVNMKAIAATDSVSAFWIDQNGRLPRWRFRGESGNAVASALTEGQNQGKSAVP